MAYLIKNDSLTWQKGHLVLELVEDNFRFYTEEAAPLCPENTEIGHTFIVDWTVWLRPVIGTWSACAETLGAYGDEYRPYSIGRTVLTKLGAGAQEMHIIDSANPADHQEGYYTLACVTPTLSNVTPVPGSYRMYWDLYEAEWRLEIGFPVMVTSDCSPVGSHGRSNGYWYITADVQSG